MNYQNDVIKLLGSDPGSTYNGVAVLTISLPNLEIVSIDTLLMDMSDRISLNYTNTDLQSRLNKIHCQFLEILNFYNPFSVSIENPFMNRFRPAAVIPLAQTVMAMELATMDYNKHMMIAKYPPSVIKNVVGAKGGANKIGVLDAMLNINEITSKINLMCLSEHEVDAIAIAYKNLTDIRNNNVLLVI